MKTFFQMTGCAPEYLTKQLVLIGQISGRLTRNKQSLNIPLFKTASGQKTFYYRAVSVWNSLDQDMKLCTDFITFKKSLKKKLLNDFLDS